MTKFVISLMIGLGVGIILLGLAEKVKDMLG